MFFSCRQGEDASAKEKEDPIPVLQNMKMHHKLVENGKVTVPFDKATVKTGNVEAIFDIADVAVSVKNEPVALEAGKETSVTISVPAVKGKHKGTADIEVRVTREKKADVKVKVESIEVKGGTDDWNNGYDYGIYRSLKYKPSTGYWEGNQPENSDVLAFKMKVDKKDVDENKITARLFQGTPRGPVILYDTEKTKAPVSGTLEDSLLIFEFDHTNCKQIAIRTYYKIEIFIDGKSEMSVFVKLRD